MPRHNEKSQKHQTPNTETQVPITKSIITERIFRLDILMFFIWLKVRRWIQRVSAAQARQTS